MEDRHVIPQASDPTDVPVAVPIRECDASADHTVALEHRIQESASPLRNGDR